MTAVRHHGQSVIALYGPLLICLCINTYAILGVTKMQLVYLCWTHLGVPLSHCPTVIRRWFLELLQLWQWWDNLSFPGNFSCARPTRLSHQSPPTSPPSPSPQQSGAWCGKNPPGDTAALSAMCLPPASRSLCGQLKLSELRGPTSQCPPSTDAISCSAKKCGGTGSAPWRPRSLPCTWSVRSSHCVACSSLTAAFWSLFLIGRILHWRVHCVKYYLQWSDLGL